MDPTDVDPDRLGQTVLCDAQRLEKSLPDEWEEALYVADRETQ